MKKILHITLVILLTFGFSKIALADAEKAKGPLMQ